MTTLSQTPNECSICFEAITEATGHAILGCSHQFHLMCVVRWFQEQEGPSSCPFCRHEVGTLDNVPIYPEGDDEDGEGSSTLSGWSGEDDGGEGDDDDESDGNSVGSIRRVWIRDPVGGQWEGRWILHRPVVTVWDPTAPTEDEVAEPPEELTEIATNIQRIWRGHRVRRSRQQVASVITLIPEAEASAAEGLLKLTDASTDWIMARMTRVT